MKTLLIATTFEAKPFIQNCDEIKPGIFECEGYRVLISGVGLVNMAAATQKAILNFQSDELINLGIAGAVNNSYKLGDILNVKNFKVFSAAEIADSSQSIWQKSYPDTSSGAGNTLFSSLHPVWNSKDKNKLIELNADLIDMEGYSFAKVCTENNIKFKSIKAVSDFLQKKSQDDFLENAQIAIDHLYSYFLQS